MSLMLEARDLVKEFPGVRAVDGISFRVRQGQCLGLLGPNGAGKTTTLEMLEGISAPTSGQVLYQGRAPDRAFRGEIGIQFQSTALQDFQTVRESLHMFASLYPRTADLEELIGLSDKLFVMYKGKLVAKFDPREVTSEQLGGYMTGAVKAEGEVTP